MSLPGRVSDLVPFDLLLSVARLGSLGLAAAEHGISQPAASTRISRLERQLGVPLIERSPRGSRLTPDGELVAGWAQTAIDAAAALDAGITSLRARSDAVLHVAASMTVAEYLLPGWLSVLRARDPETAVALSAGNSAEVAAAVLDGGADLGFVEGPDLPPGLASHLVGTDRLTVVVPPGHPWERRRSGITAAELAATPLVAREPGSGTRRYFEEALQAQGGLGWVPPVAELSSTTAIKSAVAAGIGPAVLSSLAVAPELSAGTLRAVRVTDLDLSRRLLAVWAAGRQLIGPAADLRAIAARTQATTGKNLPVAEAVDETAEEAAFGRKGRTRRGRGGAQAGDGLAVVGTGDGVDDLGLVELLRALDQRHVSHEHAIEHDLGLKARRPVGIPLGLAPARQRHAHTVLTVATQQVSVNATVTEGVNHPTRLELIHTK